LIKCIEELIKIHQIKVLLRVNKKKIPLKGFVKALKSVPEKINELEVKIKLPNKLDKERI